MNEAHKRYPRSSSFYAYSNCDAAFGLSQQSGEEPPTPHSDRGTAVHSVISGKLLPSEATSAEVDLALELEDQQRNLEKAWQGGAPVDEAFVEQRLWLRKGLVPYYSGQPDRIVRAGRRLFLPDFKTGWHPLDAFAATNCQLRSYVPLAVHHMVSSIDEVTVAIVKPGKKSPPAVFGPKEIREANEWAIDVAQTAVSKIANTPTKGPWCKYCSGKLVCPLWRDDVFNLAGKAELATKDIPDHILAEMAPKLDLAKKVIERLEARLYARALLEPAHFPDWHFEKGDKKRQIKDVQKAYEVLVVETGTLSMAQFMECTGIKISELETKVRHTKQMSTKETDGFFAKHLSHLIEHKPNKDKLVYEPQPKELGNEIHNDTQKEAQPEQPVSALGSDSGNPFA